MISTVNADAVTFYKYLKKSEKTPHNLYETVLCLT